MTLFRRREAPVETAPSGPTFFPCLPASAESNGLSRSLRSEFLPSAEPSGFRRSLRSDLQSSAEPSGFRRSLRSDLQSSAEPSGFRRSLRSEFSPPAENSGFRRGLRSEFSPPAENSGFRRVLRSEFSPSAENSGFSRGLYPGGSLPDENSGFNRGLNAGSSDENSGLGRSLHSRLPPPDENSGFNPDLNSVFPPAAYNECPGGGPFPSLRPPNDSSSRFSRGFHIGLPPSTEQSGFARRLPAPRLPLSVGMPPSAGKSSLPPENSGLSCSLPPGAFPNLDGQPGVWVIDPAAEVMTWGGHTLWERLVWSVVGQIWDCLGGSPGDKFWETVGISIVISLWYVPHLQRDSGTRWIIFLKVLKSKQLLGTDPDRNRVTWETPSSEAIPFLRKPLRRTRLLHVPAQMQGTSVVEHNLYFARLAIVG